jgi:hypothetical protein
MPRARAPRPAALALAALALAALAAALPLAAAAPAPGALVPLEEVYGSRLVAAVHYDVTGYIAMDRFAPLKPAEARQRSEPWRLRALRCCAPAPWRPRLRRRRLTRVRAGAAAAPRRWRCR